MSLPPAKPNTTGKPRVGYPGESIDTFNSVGALSERTVISDEGWKLTFTGQFDNYLNGNPVVVSDIFSGPDTRNRDQFTFSRAQVKGNSPGTPYDMISLFINGEDILAANVTITDTVTFFECSLVAPPYTVPENSLIKVETTNSSPVTMKFIS